MATSKTDKRARIPADVGGSVVIDRPPVDVWAVVANYSKDIDWRHGLVEMTPAPAGPPAAGTSVHEVLKIFGSEYVTDTVVVDVGPGLRYTFEGGGTSGAVTGGRSVTAEPSGRTRFTYDIMLTLKPSLAVMRPIVVWMMRHRLRRDLRRLAELMVEPSS